MTTEYWVLGAIAALMVLALVFFAGRSAAPGQRRLDEMRRERDAARAEAARVEGEVARHFEQSAHMFGRLADDYRVFFEHFAETAQNLGLSEGRARELLHQADPRLVAGHAEPGGEQPGTVAGDAEAAADRPGRAEWPEPPGDDVPPEAGDTEEEPAADSAAATQAGADSTEEWRDRRE